MFTDGRKLAAIMTIGAVLSGAPIGAQEETQPLPQPPLQPMPKEFKIPRPRLGIPELTPVAAQVPTDPLKKETGVTIGAQAARQTTGSSGNTAINGKIVRVEKDHMIVETVGGGVLTLHIDPEAKLMRDSTKIGYSDLAPGTTFNAVYTPRGERFWVTTLNLVPTAPPVVEVRPAPPVIDVKPAPPPVVEVRPAAPPVIVVRPSPPVVEVRPDAPPVIEVKPAPPVVKIVPIEEPRAVIVVPGTAAYETEIVRVIAPDQIVVRNESGTEFIVYMTPRTRYMMGDAAAAFVDLRPGLRIRVDDEVQGGRHLARQVIGVRR